MEFEERLGGPRTTETPTTPLSGAGLPLPPSPSDAARDRLRAALEQAAGLLPAQNPLERFVHHNPLHALEDRPFEEAVTHASRLYQTEPFLTEDAYREAWSRGRIQPADLDEALARRVPDTPVALGLTLRALTRATLLRPVTPMGGEPLAWTLSETDALVHPRADLPDALKAALLSEGPLRRLWAACEAWRPVLPHCPPPRSRPVRVRDALLALGVDLDARVHPVLIRWCAAFLDQGVAHWPMQTRERGFFRAFLEHFAAPVIGRPWEPELRALVRQALDEGWDAEEMALRCMEALGHPRETWSEVVLRKLLALRGFAGMFQRLAERPDLAPGVRLPVTLVEFLAVRLTLDRAVARHATAQLPGDTVRERLTGVHLEPDAPEVDPAWTLFQLAQVTGLGPSALEQAEAADVVALIEGWHGIDPWERRAIWHEAYERRHRVEILGAVAAHLRNPPQTEPPRVQAVFCIDDREESLRRHLEEVAPWVETFGAPGNFGISMYYDGPDRGLPVPLGPAGAEPRHLVVEARPRSRSSQLRGWIAHQLHTGSQTLVRGAAVALAGLWASGPLALRVLAPRMNRHRRALPAYEPVVDRVDDLPDANGRLRGFTLDEQVAIVRDTLTAMGLVRNFTPLVLCVAHRSDSLNNPHEAGYDCGACGGGEGGPNARVFARMANDPRVRQALAEQGIEIPDGTWFLAASHDTCSEDVELFDAHRVPEVHRRLLSETRAALDRARALNAHERVRKFENVPLDISPAAALRHVQARAADLAQPRPEYGHCTNAVCLVGRRALSRGLFLDRRAFLVSYDASTDPDGSVLARVLGAAVPVGAGINLEYWFSTVDPEGWGCGTKLPHNISGLIGVMDGHASDLRPGLPIQTIELHEPVRLLCVVEASPATVEHVARTVPAVGRLVRNGWVQLATLDPTTGALHVWQDGAFHPWKPEGDALPAVRRSAEWYAGHRDLLPPCAIHGDAPWEH